MGEATEMQKVVQVRHLTIAGWIFFFNSEVILKT